MPKRNRSIRSTRKKPDAQRREKLLAEIRKTRAERDKGYREQALKLFPHVCGRCGREFTGADLRELTVHHKDHNHFNNSPDGSNWELLCVYCHDAEHDEAVHRDSSADTSQTNRTESPLGHNPFEGLQDLLPPSEDE